MPKLSDLQGQNERAVGYVRFDFEVFVNVPVEDEYIVYEDLKKLIAQQLSAGERLMPAGCSFQDSELHMEDVDVTYEDDYDRAQDFNPNL